MIYTGNYVNYSMLKHYFHQIELECIFPCPYLFQPIKITNIIRIYNTLRIGTNHEWNLYSNTERITKLYYALFTYTYVS